MMSSCEECGWFEYGLFVYYEGQWWLVGETWWEFDCEEGPMNNAVEYSPPTGAIVPRRITLVLVPDAVFGGAGAAFKILRTGQGADGGAVIMLRESAANETELSTAFAGLAAWTRKDPKGTIAAGQAVQVSRSKAPAPYAWTKDALSRLKGQQPSDVPGVGRFRAIDLDR